MSPTTICAASSAQYDIGEVVSCKGIAEGVENSNFLLRTDTGTFILTLYEKRVDPKDLPFFIALDGASRLARPRLPDAAARPRRRRTAPSLRPSAPRSSPSSTACGRGASSRSTAPASDGRWPSCTSPAATSPCPGRTICLSPAGASSTRRAGERADEVRPGLAEELARGTRRVRGRMAARSAERRSSMPISSPTTSSSAATSSPASSISISPAPISSPTTSRSASMPGASRATAASM